MKKIIQSLLLVLVTSCSLNQMKASNALHNPNEGTTGSETEKVIRHYFKFPQILLPVKETSAVTSNSVEVLFTTDKSGQVNFVLAKTENKELKKEIEKQFMALSLKQVKSDVVNKVILNFKTI